MGRKRHTPEQIITALREAEVGLARGKSVKLISRELGITERAKWGRRFVVTATTLLIVISVLPVERWFLGPLERRFVVPDLSELQVDGIIVLAGASNVFATLHWSQPALSESAERLTEGIGLALRHPEATLVFSDGAWGLDRKITWGRHCQAASRDPGGRQPSGFVRRALDEYVGERPVHERARESRKGRAVGADHVCVPHAEKLWGVSGCRMGCDPLSRGFSNGSWHVGHVSTGLITRKPLHGHQRMDRPRRLSCTRPHAPHVAACLIPARALGRPPKTSDGGKANARMATLQVLADRHRTIRILEQHDHRIKEPNFANQ